jgi:hypothetical protein
MFIQADAIPDWFVYFFLSSMIGVPIIIVFVFAIYLSKKGDGDDN